MFKPTLVRQRWEKKDWGVNKMRENTGEIILLSALNFIN